MYLTILVSPHSNIKFLYHLVCYDPDLYVHILCLVAEYSLTLCLLTGNLPYLGYLSMDT